MALTKYKLVNTLGVDKLFITAEKREVAIADIDDALAEKMHKRGSRYIEKIEETAPIKAKQTGTEQ
jgi:hypothetical protein